MKSIGQLLSSITSLANVGVITEIKKRLEAYTEDEAQMAHALAQADIVLCPRCKDWGHVGECEEGYQEEPDCEHGGECCMCSMHVIECCQYPVYKRGPGHHYKPINLTGWNLLEQDRLKA